VGMQAWAALGIIRGLARANRVAFTRHALQRMAERQATGCRAGEQERWRVTGKDLDGDELTVVVAIDDDLFPADVALQFERVAARRLAELGVHSAEAFKFMRKALGLRASDLGALLDVAAETVSRWETGEREVDRKAAALVQAMVIEAGEGKSDMRRRLESQRRAAVKVVRRIDVGRVATA